MSSQSNPILLKKTILKEFQNLNYEIEKMYTYEQLLFILDEKCTNHKCNRVVANQLFNQSKDKNNTSNLQRMVQKYIQNLQTAKLVQQRQENVSNRLNRTKQQIQNKRKTNNTSPFVFLTLYQATIHSHFSQIPIFSYKIYPTDIPQTTIVNQLNPILNHSYTLQLQNNEFELIFFESSVEIGRWKFNGQKSQSGKQQKYTIKYQGLQVSLKIKYYDKNKSIQQQKQQLSRKIQQVQVKKNASQGAYHKLIHFQPFQKQKSHHHHISHLFEAKTQHLDQSINSGVAQKSGINNCTTSLINKLPFLKNHVRNYYYMQIFLILVECFACLYSPMPIINLILWFYTLGLMHKKTRSQIGIRFWVIFFLQILIIINNIFCVVMQVKPNFQFKYMWIFVVDIAFEIINLFLFWLVVIRKSEYDSQIQLLTMKNQE